MAVGAMIDLSYSSTFQLRWTIRILDRLTQYLIAPFASDFIAHLLKQGRWGGSTERCSGARQRFRPSIQKTPRDQINRSRWQLVATILFGEEICEFYRYDGGRKTSLWRSLRYSRIISWSISMEPELKLDQLKSTNCKFIDMESLVRTSFILRRWLLRPFGVAQIA